MSVTLEDFAWIRQGRIEKPLTQNELSYLKPIHIKRRNKDRAILLIHGFSSSPAVFRTLYPFLEHYDAVIAPVLPGHGQSIAAFSDVKPQAWVDCIQAIYQNELQSYKKVDVLGLSLGGILAHQLAQTTPIHHLFLLAPAFSLKFPMSLGPAFTSMLQTFGVSLIKNRGGNINDKTQTELVYRKIPMQTITRILSFIDAYPFKLPECQTDLFLSKHDPVVHSSNVLKLFQNHALTRVHILQAASHLLPLDTGREEIFEAVQQSSNQK